MQAIILHNLTQPIQFNKVYTVDALSLLKTMPDECVHSIVTSPPYYGLRSYTKQNKNEIGLGQTIPEYIDSLVTIFRESRRVLTSSGTLWLNIGDSYARSAGDDSKKKIVDTKIRTGRSIAGSQLYQQGNNRPPSGMKPKDLMLIPFRLAIALQEDGWYIRADNIWHKSNPLPDSAKDRTWRSHEYVFHLSKSARYYYDIVAGSVESANKKQKRNRHSVWRVATQKRRVSGQIAAMPEAIARYCISVSTRQNDIVLDPFMGGGTTASIANRMGRQFIGAEINKELVTASTPYILNIKQ